MMQITFNPTNPSQAALIGEMMARYLQMEADLADTVPLDEPATQEAVAAPTVVKRVRKAPAPFEAETPNAAAVDSVPETTAVSTASLPAAAISIADIRAVLAPLSQDGKRAEVIKLMGEFGITKLTELPVEEYADMLAAAKEL
jgi:hypothetical protein